MDQKALRREQARQSTVLLQKRQCVKQHGQHLVQHVILKEGADGDQFPGPDPAGKRAGWRRGAVGPAGLRRVADEASIV